MKKQSILKSTLQVSIFLFVTKVLGVAKQSIIATVCGANAETDAYFVATGVIIALCTVIFSSIAIPLLSMHTDRLVKEGRESSNQLINVALRLFMPMSLVIALIFASCSSIIAKLLAPSYQGAQLQILSLYIRMMSAMFVLICYSLIINVILETDKKFLPEKQQGFLQNLFVCIAALFFYRRFGMKALIASFLLAGFVQCLNVTWHARRELKLLWHVKIDKEPFMELLTLALPLLVGNAIYEINDIVDKQIATSLGSGNVSFLVYGASVNEIVTTLIISSISTVLFSHYATWIAEGNTNKVADSLLKAIDTLIVVIMPVMVMCLICGDYIVTILFGRGNFGRAAIISTAGVVIGYALGFIFQAFRATCVRVYFAFKDSKTPMFNGLISVGTNILLSLTLSRFMGVKGIAVATSIAMLLSSVLLLWKIDHYLPGFTLILLVRDCLKVLFVTLMVAVSGYYLRQWLPFGTFLSFIIIGFYVVIIYALLARAVRIMPAVELFDGLYVTFIRKNKASEDDNTSN